MSDIVFAYYCQIDIRHFLIVYCYANSKCHGTSLAMVTYFSTHFAMKHNHMSNDWTALSVSQTNIQEMITQSESVVYLSTSQISGLLVHVVFQNVALVHNNAAEVLYAKTISRFDNNNIKSLAVHFIDVLVDGNIHNQVTTNYLYSPGAIMTFVEVAAVYLSDSNFTHNVGSVIEAYDTDVYMSGNVSFLYNSGSNGAALLLLGQSHLFLYPNLSANFTYNAYKYGGAIYAFNNRVSDNKCTFQVLSRNLSEIRGPLLSFQNNIARIGHTSVSAISVYECQQMQLDIKPNASHFYNNFFHFVAEDYIMYNNDKISPSPARIVPCVKEESQHNYSNLSYKYSIFPREKFTISLAALDGGGKGIEAPVQVQFYHGQNHNSLQPSSWWLSDCESQQMLHGSGTCTNISLTIHTKQLEMLEHHQRKKRMQ